jgi:hypothetical protein
MQNDARSKFVYMLKRFALISFGINGGTLNAVIVCISGFLEA